MLTGMHPNLRTTECNTRASHTSKLFRPVPAHPSTVYSVLCLRSDRAAAHERVICLVESPMEVCRLGDANSRAGADFSQRIALLELQLLTYLLTVQSVVDPECLTQAPGAASELLWISPTPAPLRLVYTRKRLRGAYEHGANAVSFGGEIQAVVHPVDQIDVEVTEGFGHKSRCITPGDRMRRRVGGVGLNLDNAAAALPHDEHGSYQV